jgi:hypothetical protein
MRFSRSSRHPAAGIVGINLPAKEEETHDTILSNRTHNVKDGIWHSSLGSLISHPLFHLGRKNSSRGDGSGVSSSSLDVIDAFLPPIDRRTMAQLAQHGAQPHQKIKICHKI